MTDNSNTQTTAEPTWETFCDASYYDLWLVRRRSEREFGQGYHIANKQEAKHLTELLNRVAA